MRRSPPQSCCDSLSTAYRFNGAAGSQLRAVSSRLACVHGRPRMSFGRLAVGALLGLWLAAGTAQAADDYPARPIKIVVPYAVGGATDLITRVVAQSLSASLGVSVVVENRTGGGGTLATKSVSLADPDGYTLLTMTNGPFAI